MPEIVVKVEKSVIKWTDKKTNAEKQMECIKLIFANGTTLNVVSDRFNYRTYDYLKEVAGK